MVSHTQEYLLIYYQLAPKKKRTRKRKGIGDKGGKRGEGRERKEEENITSLGKPPMSTQAGESRHST